MMANSLMWRFTVLWLYLQRSIVSSWKEKVGFRSVPQSFLAQRGGFGIRECLSYHMSQFYVPKTFVCMCQYLFNYDFLWLWKVDGVQWKGITTPNQSSRRGFLGRTGDTGRLEAVLWGTGRLLRGCRQYWKALGDYWGVLYNTGRVLRALSQAD